MSDNPLLNLGDLPEFSKIKAEYITPAIKAIISDNKEIIANICSQTHHNWDSVITPLEAAEDRLSRTWSPISHLNSVMNDDKLREAHDECLALLSDYGTDLGQNKQLYQAFLEVNKQNNLSKEQKRVLENGIRDFQLSGVALDETNKTRYKAISQQLSQLSSQFSQNALDATHAWSKHITEKDQLSGLPESALALAQQTAKQQDKENGWVITLDFPSYYPVMSYADNRELRREVYTAYATKASEQGPDAGKWDNTDLMAETLSLRDEKAHILGFNNYAEYSIATKMARSTTEVISFLEQLAEHSHHQAQTELTELREFAKQEHGVDNLEAWDIAYYAEKLRVKQYDISQEELRPYFPETSVVPGLFSVVEQLYGLTINEIKDFNGWHEDVRFFEIYDRNEQLRGQFYLDLYARQNKRGGAWMDECKTRRIVEGRIQTPVAYLTCNFTPPVDGKPALFTHDEVITLFHEFGHGLHHMLTQVDYPEISGINGVAWDAVELPSQFMENWCWEKEALDKIACHYDTKTPLPDDLYQRMIAAKNFQSAMMMVRQIEFSLFDFLIHRDYNKDEEDFIYSTLGRVREQVSVVIPPDFNRFAHSFSHIFAGGYAAGYYSYKWAEVLSADAYSLFEEQGVFDQQAGDKFLTNILEKGGSEDAMDLFINFRGREPKTDALLRHSGIQ